MKGYPNNGVHDIAANATNHDATRSATERITMMKIFMLVRGILIGLLFSAGLAFADDSDLDTTIYIAWYEGGGPGTDFCAEFIFDVGGNGILAARLRTPLNVWHDLVPLVPDDWWYEEWGFNAKEPTYAELDANFPAGEYLVEITKAEGVSTATVEVPASLEWPNATPEILAPLNGADNVAWPDATLQWAAVAAPNFDRIKVEIWDEDDEYDVEVSFDDTTMTEFQMTDFEPGTTYEVLLEFKCKVQGETDNGISYEVVRSRWTGSSFATLAWQSRILIGWFELHDDGDGENYEGQFKCEVKEMGVQSVRMRVPSSIWHDLDNDNISCQNWEFKASATTYAELDAQFPSGEYRIEITTVDGVFTEIVHVPHSLERPSQPDILSPLNGDTDIAWPEIPLQWAAVPEPKYNLIGVIIEGENDEYEVEKHFIDSTMTVFLMTELEPSNHYEALVAFSNLLEGQTDEGRQTEIVRARFTKVDFATGAQPQPEMQDRINWYQNQGFELLPSETWSKAENKDRFSKGLTLRQEHVAETDPTNPDSVFRILELDLSGGMFIHCEPSSAQRVYTLQYRGSLTEGDWLDVPEQTRVSGGTPLEGISHEGSVFYRVLVELP